MASIWIPVSSLPPDRDGFSRTGPSITPPSCSFARTKTPAENSDVYGAGFWVTPAAGRGKPQQAFAPSGPRDIFLAQGHEGQVVVVVPSRDLVLVRLGLFDDFVGWRPLGEWAVGIINLFPDVSRN